MYIFQVLEVQSCWWQVWASQRISLGWTQKVALLYMERWVSQTSCPMVLLWHWFKPCKFFCLLIIINIIEQKRLQWYSHVKRMLEERIPKLIMDWIPQERRKRGRPRRTWMEGVQAAMTTRNLEPDQWRNREEWRLVSGRWRQLFKKTGQIDR